MRAFFLCCGLLAGATALAAPKSSGPLPPSAVVFGNNYLFTTGSTTFPGTINVPTDGAWFYGNATVAGTGGWMDCIHHYEVDLNPTSLSPNYTPFLDIGYVDGIDSPCQFSNACFSCSMEWGGTKGLTNYTTGNSPGWLPSGTGTATLKTLNGGGSTDAVNFSLNQVNMSAMQSMSVFEATANDLPVQASQEDINSRAYIAASDDRVPLVPRFAYGTDMYPSPPRGFITYGGTWDTGDPAAITASYPYPGNLPGLAILLVEIPSMKTGNHKVTITATLPSGKTFTAPAYTVYVYNGAIEASVNSGTFTTGAITFPRAANVVFRINQQDAKGKTITITKADWKFHGTQTAIDVLGIDDSLAVNAAQWGGTMNQNGIMSANVTIQVGKTSRTSHAAIATTAVVTARTGGSWTTTQTLCENCWDDLATTNGGSLDLGLFLPTDQNLQDSLSFASNGTITRGQTGDRLSYENGIKDPQNPQSFLLHPRLAPKPYPLYRPFDPVNDPSDWPNRYTITQITTGPNRLFWYVTQQNFRTDFGYAVSAYFNPTSLAGANTGAYASFLYNPACGTPSDQACYALTPLSCWAAAHGAQSYVQAANATINPQTNSNYQMNLLFTQIQTHEKTRHWQDAVITFVSQNKLQYDIGTIMEALTSRRAAEADARQDIDQFVWTLDAAYLRDPQGGAYEVFTDPHTDAPLIEDIPIGNANCALYHP
jgi:hypothetical protein